MKKIEFLCISVSVMYVSIRLVIYLFFFVKKQVTTQHPIDAFNSSLDYLGPDVVNQFDEHETIHVGMVTGSDQI